MLHQLPKYIFSLLPVVQFIHLDCFGVRDVCLLSNVMEVDCKKVEFSNYLLSTELHPTTISPPSTIATQLRGLGQEDAGGRYLPGQRGAC